MDKVPDIAILKPEFIVSDIIGKRLGHYEITAKLGQGGMGEVYRALDTRLDREVAIKVLPPVFAEDPDRLVRFGREAKVLASLDHANIASIYGVEVFDGQHCLILQLVEGESLDKRIARGPLEVDVALAIGKQIVDALSAAHDRGVIHRDLKPANVMITDEQTVKVLDFGIAKLSADDPESKLGQVMASTDSNASTVAVDSTRPGMFFGTPAYMSPEQARGLMIDRRTDVWAFGCCLFEMLSGHKPFKGETTKDLLADMAKVDPDWASLPAETPPAVLTVLRRCLEKETHRRLSSTGDIAITLEETNHISRVGGSTLGKVRAGNDKTSKKTEDGFVGKGTKIAAVAILCLGFIYALFDLITDWSRPSSVVVNEIHSIAVLPFEVEGDDEALLNVAIGLAEQIREDLNRIEALDGNIGSRYVKDYRGSELDGPAIAAELEVDGLVSGSLRQVGGELEATIQLVHGPTANTFWTTNLSNVKPMLLKGQITRSFLEQFNVNLRPEEQAYLKQSNPVGLEAYTSYRQGLAYLNQFTLDSVGTAIGHFKKAISQDPLYLPPYLSLAKAHWLPTVWGGHTGTAKEGLDLAKGVLAEAKVQFPNEPSIDRIQGYLGMIADFDWPRAKEGFDQALIHSESDPEVYYQQCLYLLFVEGRYADALRSIEMALQIRPERVAYLDALAEVYSFMEDEQKGLKLNREIRELVPGDWSRRMNVALNLKNLGLKDPDGDWLDQALAEAIKGVEASRRSPALLAVLAEIHAARNEMDEMSEILVELEQQQLGGQFVPGIWIARVEAQRGNLDAAVHLLNRCYEQKEGSSLLYNMRKVDLMAMLSDHEGYWDLVQKMDYPALPINHRFYGKEQSIRFRKELGPATTIRSLLVLPYVNERPGNQTGRWVSDAIHEETLLRLRKASLDGVTILGAHTISERNEQSGLELARSMGGDAVVQGRFAQQDGIIKVWTSITDAATGLETPLEIKEAAADRILGLISEVVTSIAEQVQSERSVATQKAIEEDRDIAAVSYIAYRKGIEAMASQSDAGFELARANFSEAMRLDPDFAAPYLALGKSIWMPTIWGQSKMNPEQAFVQANALLATAERYAPANVQVIAARGIHTLVGDWGWTLAHQYTRQAKEQGGSAIPLAWYLCLVESRYSEAETVIDEILQKDANRLDALLVKATIVRLRGDYNRATSIYDSIEKSRIGWPEQLHHAESLFWSGRDVDALSLVQDAIEVSDSHPAAMLQMAALLGFSGREEEARGLLTEARNQLTDDLYFPTAGFAHAYLGLEDLDMALSSLEAGFEEKGSWAMLELRQDLFLRKLGDDDRFWGLVRAMKFPELPVYHKFYLKEQSRR